MGTGTYEVYAIAYGRVERRAAANFIGGVEQDGSMPLAYYVWVIRGEGRVILVDTGFDQARADERKRTLIRPVEEGLRLLSIAPDDVQDIIITHMHYDHAGNRALFPRARYHLQDAEMSFATGRCMCHPQMRGPYDVEDVCAMVRRVFAGQVRFHSGANDILPGVRAVLVGGHSRGLQIVVVSTRGGSLVLASDAVPFYAHLESRRVYPVVDCMSDLLDSYEKIERLAETPRNIVPGHDPEVLRRFPSYSEATEGWIVRLD